MAAPDNRSDEALVMGIARGESAAMSELFRRRQQNVFRFALHLTGSTAVADDVTQDVFVTVIHDAGRYEAGRSSVAAWLCGIARNFVRRRIEGARRDEPLDDDGDEGGGPVVHPDPLGDLTRAEALEALHRAVLSLPLRYREAIVLCDLQEMSYADAAGVLGCPIGTVRSRLSRGRALLTGKMQAAEPCRAALQGCDAGRVAGLKACTTSSRQ